MILSLQGLDITPVQTKLTGNLLISFHTTTVGNKHLSESMTDRPIVRVRLKTFEDRREENRLTRNRPLTVLMQPPGDAWPWKLRATDGRIQLHIGVNTARNVVLP